MDCNQDQKGDEVSSYYKHTCVTCGGSGRLDPTDLTETSRYMRKLRNGDPLDCVTCSGTGRIETEIPSEGAIFTCEGCGKKEVGEYYRDALGWCKPAHWYLRHFGEKEQVACSVECAMKVSKETGGSSDILPY